MHVELIDLVRVGLWFIAGLISLYFSLGNARIWASISTGFLLVFVSEGYLVAPWVQNPAVVAMHAVVGTMAALAVTHGFMEYYVFSRTMEASGAKWKVYALTLAVLAGSIVFIVVNPTPTAVVTRHIRLIENACWVFFAIINLDMLRKIHAQVRDTPIGPGFIGFGVVFACIFLWRGAELYLQVYGWDEATTAIGRHLGDLAPADYPFRVALATQVNHWASVASSVALGGTFVFLTRALR